MYDTLEQSSNSVDAQENISVKIREEFSNGDEENSLMTPEEASKDKICQTIKFYGLLPTFDQTVENFCLDYGYIFKLDEHTRRFIFFTDKHEYSIRAKIEPGNTYLGCISKNRTPSPGEFWLRGNDLPDGDMTEDTANKIKQAIIRNECQLLSSYVTKNLFE